MPPYTHSPINATAQSCKTTPSTNCSLKKRQRPNCGRALEHKFGANKARGCSPAIPDTLFSPRGDVAKATHPLRHLSLTISKVGILCRLKVVTWYFTIILGPPVGRSWPVAPFSRLNVWLVPPHRQQFYLAQSSSLPPKSFNCRLSLEKGFSRYLASPLTSLCHTLVLDWSLDLVKHLSESQLLIFCWSISFHLASYPNPSSDGEELQMKEASPFSNYWIAPACRQICNNLILRAGFWRLPIWPKSVIREGEGVHQYKLELGKLGEYARYEVMYRIGYGLEEALGAIKLDTRSSPAQGSTLPSKILHHLPFLVRCAVVGAKLCKNVHNCVHLWILQKSVCSSCKYQGCSPGR